MTAKDFARVLSVATKGVADYEAPRRLDIKNLNEEELNRLHVRDAFMFHSIPGIHKATLLSERIDYSNPSSFLDRDDDRPPVDEQSPKRSRLTVSRRTRISTEVDPLLLLLSHINDCLDEDAEDDVNTIGDEPDTKPSLPSS